MAVFDPAIALVLENEGGLEDNKADAGDITNFGISLRFLRSIPIETLKAYGIFVTDAIGADDIRHLTLDQAKALYRGEFWYHAPFCRISNQIVCNYLFDMAVNMGIAPAIKCAQRATWAILKDWEKLPDDGILGSASLDAINSCGPLLLTPLRAERGDFYRNLVEREPHNREFLRGWYDRTYLG